MKWEIFTFRRAGKREHFIRERASTFINAKKKEEPHFRGLYTRTSRKKTLLNTQTWKVNCRRLIPQGTSIDWWDLSKRAGFWPKFLETTYLIEHMIRTKKEHTFLLSGDLKFCRGYAVILSKTKLLDWSICGNSR